MSKSLIVLCFATVLGVAVVSAGCQPGCRTRYELNRKWGDEGVSSGYWQCIRWGQSEFKLCPTGTKFSEPYQTCVPSKSWEALPYYSPPSCFGSTEDACGFVDIEKCPTPTCPPEIHCGLGVEVNGKCVCNDNAELVNEVCVAKPEIDTCENGVFIDGLCVCNEGFQFIEGVCIKLPVPNGVCPGALPQNSGPGPMSCEAPVCSWELWEQKTHYPTRDPTTYFKCENYFHTEVRPCAPGTCFHYIKQVCVHPEDWVNPCN